MVRDVGGRARVRRVGFSCRDDMVAARNALRADLVPAPALQSAVVGTGARVTHDCVRRAGEGGLEGGEG
mgnify:CR=1 FL=1